MRVRLEGMLDYRGVGLQRLTSILYYNWYYKHEYTRWSYTLLACNEMTSPGFADIPPEASDSIYAVPVFQHLYIQSDHLRKYTSNSDVTGNILIQHLFQTPLCTG